MNIFSWDRYESHRLNHEPGVGLRGPEFEDEPEPDAEPYCVQCDAEATCCTSTTSRIAKSASPTTCAGGRNERHTAGEGRAVHHLRTHLVFGPHPEKTRLAVSSRAAECSGDARGEWGVVIEPRPARLTQLRRFLLF